MMIIIIINNNNNDDNNGTYVHTGGIAKKLLYYLKSCLPFSRSGSMCQMAVLQMSKTN